ncbi:hypothetical protein [Halomonas caseinilytica]|uniref:hypothetical protein n=1 Tax=Halomonas caseinilytica TaxID=438744 RepID=UPI0010BE6980|nr:hypothetical protein [Halomonas caseinilytica]
MGSIIDLAERFESERSRNAFFREYPDFPKYVDELVDEKLESMLLNGELDELLARHGYVKVSK